MITCRDKQHALTDQLTKVTGVLVFVSVCEHLINLVCAGINYISGCGKGLAWIIIIVCCVNVCYHVCECVIPKIIPNNNCSLPNKTYNLLMSAPLLSCYVTCRKLLRIICCFCNFFPPPFLFTVDDALQLISSLFSCNSEILFIHSYANNTEIKHFFPFIFSILIIFYPPNFLHFSIHLLYSH